TQVLQRGEGVKTLRNARRLGLTAMIIFSAILFAIAPSATAMPPEITTFTDEVIDEVFATCTGFVVLSTYIVDVRITEFFDRDGNPKTLKVHIQFDGTATNSGSGKTVRDHSDATVTIDLVSGGFTVVGLGFVWTFPGEGLLFLNVGRISFDSDENIVFVAGPHPLELEGEEVLCAALD
ncbi:MAG TPA: hypothetical protein VIL58_01685, partial [Thermoplasmata archaeon]